MLSQSVASSELRMNDTPLAGLNGYFVPQFEHGHFRFALCRNGYSCKLTLVVH